MSPAERRKQDHSDKYNSDYKNAVRKAQRSLKTMSPGQTRTLHGVSVNGRAVQVHRSSYQDLIRMANPAGTGTTVFGSDKGRWVQQGNDAKNEGKKFGTAGLGGLSKTKGGSSAKASSGHSGG